MDPVSVKQVIAVRKDLNMRKGKLAAQVAHASLKVFLNWGSWTDTDAFELANMPHSMAYWLKHHFTKVVVSVDSEEEIYELGKKAEAAGLPYAIIVDNGFTEFHGNKTTTCIAIGPSYNEDFDTITKDLPLL